MIEKQRALFEADAESYGFDLARSAAAENPGGEPWSEYADPATGHRWGGWLAARQGRREEAVCKSLGVVLDYLPLGNWPIPDHRILAAARELLATSALDRIQSAATGKTQEILGAKRADGD